MSEQHTLSEGQTMVLQARIGSVCASERFWFCTIGHQGFAHGFRFQRLSSGAREVCTETSIYRKK